VEVVLIAALMAPSLAAYLRNWNGWSWFTAEIVIHHILGVIAVLALHLLQSRDHAGRQYPLAPASVHVDRVRPWIVVLAMGNPFVLVHSGGDQRVNILLNYSCFSELWLYA